MTRDLVDQFKDRDRGRFGDNEALAAPPLRQKRSDRAANVTLTLRLMEDRPTSLAVVDPAQLGKVKWSFLPKSQISFESRDESLVEVTMPLWLAIKEGFA